MKTALVTFVRQWKTLHYPLEVMLDCAKACDERLVVMDPSDPDLGESITAVKAISKDITIGLPDTPWSKMKERGNDLMRKLLELGLKTAVDDFHCDHVLHLEADEVMDPEDVKSLINEAPAVAWLPSWQLWKNMGTIRLDWCFQYPRFAAIDALVRGFNKGEGEASCLPVKPDHAIAQFPRWPIWHLSRIGHPRMIARRRFAIAEMYTPAEQLDVPEEYDFVTRRYEDWTRGKMPPRVSSQFALVGSTVIHSPLGQKVSQWVYDDMMLGSTPEERRAADEAWAGTKTGA